MRSTSLLVVIMLIVVLLAHDTHNMFAQSRLFPGGASSNPLKTAAGVIATMLFATMVVTGGMQKTQRPIEIVRGGMSMKKKSITGAKRPMQTSRPESCTTAQYMAKMIQRGNARRTEEKIKTRDDLTLFFATDDAMQTVVSREEKEALPLDDYLASNLDMQSPEPMQLIPTVKVVPQGYK
jgi:hypothetical protein